LAWNGVGLNMLADCRYNMHNYVCSLEEYLKIKIKKKMQLSLHRILAEIKLIDSKIEKKMSVKFIGWKQKDRPICAYYEATVFDARVQGAFQSISDLINKKQALKKALSEANSTTIVRINDKQMTIADAINYKHLLPLKKQFLQKLERDFASAQEYIEQHNNKVDENALKLAQTALGKDNVKLTEGEAVSVTKPYIEANQLKFHDPLNLKKIIDEFREEIEGFEMEVDTVLSEANAITLMEVD
jgi:hypothetical protein